MLLSNEKEIETAVKGALAKLAPFRPFSYEDFYQIGWLAAMTALPKFDKKRGTKLSAYLTQVVYHHLLQEINKLRKIPLTNTDISYMTQEKPVFSLSDLELNEEERAVFYCRVYDDMSFEEIGKELNISRETARRRYNGVEARIKREIRNA